MVKSYGRAARTIAGSKPSLIQTGEPKAIPWHAAINLQTWLVERFQETDQ